MSFRLQLISDVHVEFDRDGGAAFVETLEPALTDVVVIAGDLGMHQLAMHALEAIVKKYWPKPVIYVHGNHEYYSSNLNDVKAATRALEMAHENLTFLDRDVVTIDGQRFVGATLWYRDHGKYNWSDFRHIKGIHGWISRTAQEEEKFFEENIQEGDIVISHMLPSDRCVAPRWHGNPENIFFLNDVTDIIEAKKPKLWLFGHTHDPIDVVVGSTRCVCRPRGYPFEDTKFNPKAVLEVS